MTNGEAINWLRNIAADIGKAEHRELWHYEQALFEIMEMLEAQPVTITEHESDLKLQKSNDTISRKAAIDALDKRFDDVPMELTVEILQLRRDLRERMPSAQPEIVRCKDCKHRYTDDCLMRFTETVWYDDDGYEDFDEIVTDNTTDDGYCYDAERRTDAETEV